MRFGKNKKDTSGPIDPGGDLEKAEAFAKKYCNPDDSEIISDLDRHARETAWALLQRIKHLEAQSCLCDECEAKVEEETEEEVNEEINEGTEKVEVEENIESKPVKSGGSDASTIEKLADVADRSKDILEKAAKGTVAVTAATATTQTASAATGLSAFVQETTQKITAIGVAGTMSIGSGAYFQAKTTKEKGTEIAVVAEQEHGVFSSLNDYAQVATGFQPFSTIVDYAENGYGDIKGKPGNGAVTGATSSSGGGQAPIDIGIENSPIKTPPTATDISKDKIDFTDPKQTYPLEKDNKVTPTRPGE